MTTDEWETISLLIEEGWPGEFTDDASKAWRVFLDGFSAPDVLGALKRLALQGGKFRPSVAEVAAEIRSDPARPTFAEVLDLIYAKGGIIRARPTQRWFDAPSDKAHAEHEARVQRCKEVHPWVGDFAVRYGIDRLYHLPINDPEYGDAKRRELERAWTEYCSTAEGRDIAAIAAGVGGTNGSLKRLDPLSVLPGHAPDREPVGELEAGR